MYTYENDSMTGEVLQDKSKSGRERPWKPKKEKSGMIADSVQRNGWESRAIRMHTCGSWLKFMECEEDEYKKLVNANFCRDRICPMCNWRRSLKLQGQIMNVLHRAVEDRRMHFLFVTLTIRNISGSELPGANKRLLKAFERFIRYDAVDKHCIGYVRNLEVTYNRERDDYHPHIHALIAVEPEYFVSGYLKKNQWVEFWQKALDVDYPPSVYVKTVKVKEGQTLGKAAAEIGKYSVKDDDYIVQGSEQLRDEVVYHLATGLKSHRLVGFGKLFRQIHKELNLDDLEGNTADLVGAKDGECSCPLCGSGLREQIYKWHYGYSEYIG